METKRKTKHPKGKAIYKPTGKAGEYSEWACNYFTGCSNDCDYCYCKRGVLGHIWSTTPQLKKCFKDENHAIDVFSKELERNVEELRKSGIFFSFTTDPMLPETYPLTIASMIVAMGHGVPTKILTKRTDMIMQNISWFYHCPEHFRKMVAIGFTLTGHDELEPNASSNEERISAMRILHGLGFKTFVSLEPVIDIDASWKCLVDSHKHCDVFKIGLMSGGAKPSKKDVSDFVTKVESYLDKRGGKVYWKRSITDYIGDAVCHNIDVSVDAEYNIFS